MRGRHAGPRLVWFPRIRESRRVLDRAQALKFPTHRKELA